MRNVIYVAVLPFYRQACAEQLVETTGSGLALFAGDHHVDKSVRTGISDDLYTRVHNLVIGGRALLQIGHWKDVMTADNVVLDLNPRSLSAWVLLLLRRLTGRRTLLWGHLHPRAGAGSKTAVIRNAMRRLAHGTILYGYDSVVLAKRELPASPIWVAPNALYSAKDLTPALGREPRSFLYVGRLVTQKKVDLLIRAFARSNLTDSGYSLVIVGEGEDRAALEQLARDLNIAPVVKFFGHESDPDKLRLLYSEAVASVSPGYAGLSLTQSLGFGVPMIVSKEERHAPEIELRRLGGVRFFHTDSVESLATALTNATVEQSSVSRSVLSGRVASTYSAEGMAKGLLAALEGHLQELGDDGWPKA